MTFVAVDVATDVRTRDFHGQRTIVGNNLGSIEIGRGVRFDLQLITVQIVTAGW